ncbi:hypothetical protein BDY21DRAFT_348220 [Lineolata rhizophorae]|uniref:Uncharacterized protein n=1 Tax=Lineolata rhizophorae TaxID=578093 RepID=A0A6A6NY67_9PEZI|nr:hypothetical protein BDY21DRAFT_348220 [Lineolata rhizophorae]
MICESGFRTIESSSLYFFTLGGLTKAKEKVAATRFDQGPKVSERVCVCARGRRSETQIARAEDSGLILAGEQGRATGVGERSGENEIDEELTRIRRYVGANQTAVPTPVLGGRAVPLGKCRKPPPSAWPANHFPSYGVRFRYLDQPQRMRRDSRTPEVLVAAESLVLLGLTGGRYRFV